MHTPTRAKQLSRIFDRIVEVRMSGCRAIRPHQRQVRDGQTNTRSGSKFSGEMPPGPASRWRLYALHQDRRSAR